eukprot:Pgem_evm1s2814
MHLTHNSFHDNYINVKLYQDKIASLSINNSLYDYEGLDLNKDSYVQYAYIIAGAISFIFNIIVCLSYSLFPRTRQRPSNILLFRSLSDLLLSVNFILSAVFTILMLKSDLLERNDDYNNNYTEHMFCTVNGFITQYCLTSSYMWFLIVSIDLMLTIRNPFRHRMQNMYFYQFLAISISILLSVIPAIYDMYGTSFFKFCWIKLNPNPNDINYFSWGFSFLPVCVAYFISSIILCYAYWVMYDGLRNRSCRRRIIFQSTVYMLTFGTLWTYSGIVWALQYTAPSPTVYYEILFAISIALRGITNLVAFGYNHVWLLDLEFNSNKTKEKKSRIDIFWALCGIFKTRLFSRKPKGKRNVYSIDNVAEFSEVIVMGFQTLGRAQVNFGEFHIGLKSFYKAKHLNPALEFIYEDMKWAQKLWNVEKTRLKEVGLNGEYSCQLLPKRIR